MTDAARFHFPASTIASIDAGILADRIQDRSGGGLFIPWPREAPTNRERREFVMRLIEKHCTLDALYPDRIEITAPMVAVGATEMSDYTLIFKDHAAWKASGLKFLEDSAPESVISGLALSRLNRMRVERPAEFSEWVRKQAAVGLPKSPTGMTEDGELAAFGKPEG